MTIAIIPITNTIPSIIIVIIIITIIIIIIALIITIIASMVIVIITNSKVTRHSKTQPLRQSALNR